MKYYKFEYGFGVQPNDILPPDSIEITREEYEKLEAEFAEHQANVAHYVEQVLSGAMTLEDVPEEYREEVSEIVNAPEPEPLYTLDEASEIITREVAE